MPNDDHCGRIACVPPVSRATTDDTVERAVLHLNGLCKSTTLAFALNVGRIVIDHFYSGDLGRWRARSGGKEVPLRKLARHPDLAMSAVALYRSIAIYELCERLDIREWTHISTAHIRLVLPLATAEQERLLRLAEHQAWTVRRLDIEVTRAPPGNHARNGRGGRKRTSPLRTTIVHLRTCVQALDSFLTETDDWEASSEVWEGGTSDAISLLQTARRQCEALETRLARVVSLRETGALEEPLPGHAS